MRAKCRVKSCRPAFGPGSRQATQGAIGLTQKFNYPIWCAVSVDRQDSSPLHVQIFDQLRQRIVDGELSKGSRLPPSRKLAAELHVSRNTIVLVYDRLLSEGYVEGRIGIGTFIAADLPEDSRPCRGAGAPSDGQVQASGQVSRRAQAQLLLPLPSERNGSYRLSPTVPALDQLPFDQFAKVSAQYWRSAPTTDLGYGSPLGLPDLREQIALYLGEAHGLACSAEQVLVISGTTQGFLLAGQVLADPGDEVIVEDPAYLTRVAALTGSGLRLVHVPIDQEGLDSHLFDTYAPRAKLIVASPTNQFPFGSTMPLHKRLNLLEWAQDRDAWIIEYDFNNAFHFSGRALPPLASLDRGGRVVYIGNFNRSVSPALNLAYMVVPEALVDAFSRNHHVFSFQAAVPMQGVIADFMGSGQLAAHIRRMGSRYRERANLVVQCLKSLPGIELDISATGAGLHLSAMPKVPVDDAAVSNALLAHRIDVPAMSGYCVSERIRSGFVIGFGNTSTDRITPAIRVFSDVLRQVQGEAPRGTRGPGT